MTLKIGLIGCGAIAPAYMKGLGLFPDVVSVVACADLDTARAQAFAEKYNLRALSTEELLADDAVDIVVNLTIPVAHAEVSLEVIAAGKHVYSEKPLAIRLQDGQRIIEAARATGVRVGCAPDTFLGGGIQTARHLLDSGVIGRPVAASAFFLSPGPQSWHPNPFFYFTEGGGPMLDMGPYYLTALVNLLGPVTGVAAMTGRTRENRVAGHEAIRGQAIPVSVDTHAAGTLAFASGALSTVVTSFDSLSHNLPHIEIYGTQGTLSLPSPNYFGGQVRLWQASEGEWRDMPLTQRSDVQRGIGVVDMARGIQTGQPHRASGDLALHVLETMLAFEESQKQQRHIAIESHVAAPEALPVISRAASD